MTRSGLDRAPSSFPAVGTLWRRFLRPPVTAIAAEAEFRRAWTPGGPWK